MIRFTIFFFILFLLGCQKQDEIMDNRLSDYLDQSGLVLSNSLIACAASFPLANVKENLTNSIFFLPIKGARDFKYFETRNIDENPDDLKNYFEIELDHEPVFNFLKKFNRPQVQDEVWCKVTYIVNDSLHICNAIRIKEPIKPSEINPGLIVSESLGKGSVKFSWVDGIYLENAIYFQVVSDDSGNLITGTYTYDQTFTFFDPSNIVLNINPSDHIPKLDPGDYQFTLMAVSIDNWVNLLGTIDFQVD